jgi:hypothetical protein
MGKIIDEAEVQDELDRAARDARHGPRDIRAGRFVHADARGDRASATNRHRVAPSKATPRRNGKPNR